MTIGAPGPTVAVLTGGVLFEVATVGPGFTVDETLAELGRELKLPPWEEPNRAAIEKGLPVVSRIS